MRLIPSLAVSLALLASLPLVACLDFSPMTGAKSPHSPSSSTTTSSSSEPTGSLDPTAPDCPESKVPCLGDKECSFDDKRECMVCHCASPLGSTPNVGGVPALQ